MRLLLVPFLAFLICSCGKKQEVTEDRKLNICFESEIKTLDPRVGAEYPTSHAIRMLFDGLTRRDENGVIAPAVAESYVISEDFKTYTFHLRKSFWTDGEPVTAHDFEYAWKKTVNPKTLGHGAQNFYFIKNAQKSTEGKISVDEVGVKALDDQTLQVKLEYPVPYILEVLACSLFYPVPKHIDENDPAWIFRTNQTLVSNGPFQLKKWKRGDYLEVVKNPTYWDESHVRLPSIKVQFIGQNNTHLYLYEKKEIDWLGDPLTKIPLEAVNTIKKGPGYRSVESPRTYWYFINTEKFPYTNKKLRQALAYAINRQELVEHLNNGEGMPAQGIISPSFKIGNAPCFEDANFERAQVLFEEALKELNLTRETFPTITIKYAGQGEALNRTSLAVQQYWEQAFGIKVNLQNADWSVHFTSIQKGDYEIGLMGWVSFMCDPIYMLQTFKYKDDLVNMSFWQSDDYVNLLEASNYESDPEKRKEILIEAEKVLMDGMPIIPLNFAGMVYMKNPELMGVNLSPSGEIDFKFASFCR